MNVTMPSEQAAPGRPPRHPPRRHHWV